MKTTVRITMLATILLAFGGTVQAGRSLREIDATIQELEARMTDGQTNMPVLCELAIAYADKYDHLVKEYGEGRRDNAIVTRAIQYASEARQIDRDSPLPSLAMARVNMSMGDFEIARYYAERARRADPESVTEAETILREIKAKLGIREYGEITIRGCNARARLLLNGVIVAELYPGHDYAFPKTDAGRHELRLTNTDGLLFWKSMVEVRPDASVVVDGATGRVIPQ